MQKAFFPLVNHKMRRMRLEHLLRPPLIGGVTSILTDYQGDLGEGHIMSQCHRGVTSILTRKQLFVHPKKRGLSAIGGVTSILTQGRARSVRPFVFDTLNQALPRFA